MFQVITPPGMLFTTALLAIYGTYALLIGMIERSMPLQLGAVVSIAAVYGTALVRSWSTQLVYLVTAGFIAKLGSSILEAQRAEFFGFQFGSTWEIAWPLIPSLIMALLSLVCCVILRRQFQQRPAPVPLPQFNA